MDFPYEVWSVTFSFLSPNDLQVSTTCKSFYFLAKKNRLFIRKWNDSKTLSDDKKKYL